MSEKKYKYYRITKAGEGCPRCKKLHQERIIKRIKIECDSFCRFIRQCQEEIDTSGLEGFKCKDRTWGPTLGATCDARDQSGSEGGECKFAINGAREDGTIWTGLWKEGYPHSWDGWSW